MESVSRLVLTLACFFPISAPALAAVQPLPTVSHVDLTRYQGKWFEIARLPLSWENKCASNVTATYTPRPDGKITVLNQCLKSNGETSASNGYAKPVAGDSSNAKLKVTFFWPFFGDYWILSLDPGYRWALVGDPSRKHLWILSRTPHLSPETTASLLAQAKSLGFNTDPILHTKQQ